MQTCDVLIVGGGPGGSTCAWRLREAGLDVVVMDKREFPRDKTCAGWITPAVVEELGLDVGAYAASGRVIQPITAFRTGLIGGRTMTNHYDRVMSYGIRRCEFDHYLLERCAEGWTRLVLGEAGKATTFERVGSGKDAAWIVNGSIRARLLVGAGGHTCPVARMMAAAATAPLPPARELIVAAQEIEYRMDPAQAAACAVSAAVPELYFCPDLKGYGWCFRKGDYLNIGLGREDDPRVGDAAAAFVGLLKEQGRIPADAPEKLHGHAYILYGHTVRPLTGEGVLLIGDAAGLAYVASGEGIRPAVESGLMAAGVIAGAGGDYSKAGLRVYEDRLRGRFGKVKAGRGGSGEKAQSTKLKAQIGGGRMTGRLQEMAAPMLMGSRWFSRRVLLERWFLHAHEPALAAE